MRSRLLGRSTSPNNVSVCHQILQMFEDNYPEGLKRLFVIKGESVLPPRKRVSINKLFVIVCLCSFYHYMLARLSVIACVCFVNAFDFFSCSPQALSCGVQPRQALSEWEHKTKDPYPRGWDTIPLSYFILTSKFSPIKTLWLPDDTSAAVSLVWQLTGRRFYWSTSMQKSCRRYTGASWQILMEILAVGRGWVSDWQAKLHTQGRCVFLVLRWADDELEETSLCCRFFQIYSLIFIAFGLKQLVSVEINKAEDQTW